jgi:hypothetical protein
MLWVDPAATALVPQGPRMALLISPPLRDAAQGVLASRQLLHHRNDPARFLQGHRRCLSQEPAYPACSRLLKALIALLGHQREDLEAVRD